MTDLSAPALENMPIADLRALNTLLCAAIAMRSILGEGAVEVELIEDEGFSLVITTKEQAPCAPSA